MKKSNFALRLQPSLLDEARKLAEQEGVALNRLITFAVAEKRRERPHRRIYGIQAQSKVAASVAERTSAR